MKRGLNTAAVAALVAVCPAAAMAQAVPDSVPANTQELRDFRINPDGSVARVPPPQPVVTEPVAVPTPAPVPNLEITPLDLPRPQVEEEPSAAEPATRPNGTRGVVVRPGRTDRPVAVNAAPTGVPEELPAQAPEAPALAPPVVADATPLTASPVTGDPATVTPDRSDVPVDDSRNGLWIAMILAGLAAVSAFILMKRRRERSVEDEPASDVVEDEPATEIAAPVEPEPLQEVPVVAAVAHPTGTAARPQLDIVFTPAAAGATDAQASVDYSLIVANNGDAPASKVRMEARMFAMGGDHDAELANFFAGPLERSTPIASAIAPGVEAGLRAQVTLPRDAVRPIQMRDRTLFVPLVAFNLLYEWYDAEGGVQHGQTAVGYVVGRENRPPAEKMAPFRLDQGPKIYREVGQREHQIKQVA